jgi:hypothetical protein
LDEARKEIKCECKEEETREEYDIELRATKIRNANYQECAFSIRSILSERIKNPDIPQENTYR